MMVAGALGRRQAYALGRRRWLCGGVPPPAGKTTGLRALLPPSMVQATDSAMGALGKIRGSMVAAKTGVEAAQTRVTGTVASAKNTVDGVRATVTGTVASAKSSVEGAKAAVTGSVASAKSSVEGAKAAVAGSVASAKMSVDGAKSKLERQATMVKGGVNETKSGVMGNVELAKARLRGSVALATGSVGAAKAHLVGLASVQQGLPPAVKSLGTRLGVPPNVLRVVGQGLGITRNVAALVARTVEPLAVRAFTRVLPKDKAEAVRKALNSSVGIAAANGRNLYQKYKLYIHASIAVLGFVWVVQKVLAFIGTFVHTLESLAVYLIYMGTGLLMMTSALLLRGRFSLSARKAHDRAAHLVAQSAEPVVIEKLGNKIKRTPGHQRIVTRSGGEFKLKWPQAQAQVATAAAMKIQKDGAQNPSTEVVVGTEEKMPELLVQLMDTAVMKTVVKYVHGARDRGLKLMQTLNIPTLIYKPQRAYLVFPVEGKVKAASGDERSRRAMVSCEVKKSAGGMVGYYHIKLLAVDFPDDTYTILYGTQEKYDNDILVGLRKPMISWLQDSQQIDTLHELEDEIDEGIYPASIQAATPPAA